MEKGDIKFHRKKSNINGIGAESPIYLSGPGSRIFYQTVVAMSQKSYERRLLSMLLKYGTPRPQEFDDVDKMVAAISHSDCGIAYMWSDDAASHDAVKSIRLLWQGD